MLRKWHNRQNTDESAMKAQFYNTLSSIGKSDIVAKLTKELELSQKY